MPTANYALRYPALGEAPNVPLDIQELANDVDAALDVVDDRVDVLELATLRQTSGVAKRVHMQHITGVTTDASGIATITHAAGFVPTAAAFSSRAIGTSFALIYGADTFTSTTVRARVMNASIGGMYASAATGAFTIWLWE